MLQTFPQFSLDKMAQPHAVAALPPAQSQHSTTAASQATSHESQARRVGGTPVTPKWEYVDKINNSDKP